MEQPGSHPTAANPVGSADTMTLPRSLNLYFSEREEMQDSARNQYVTFF